MNQDRVFEYYTQADHEDLLDLFRSGLRNVSEVKPKTLEVFQWEHETNPFGKSYGLLARTKAGNELIGARMLLRWHFRDAQGRSIPSVRAVDTVTAPAYRGQGIFSELTSQALLDIEQEGVQFVFNNPNDTVLPKYRALGWQVVGALPLYVKIRRPVRICLSFLQGGSSRQTAPAWNRVFGRKILSPQEFTHRFTDGKMEEFLSKATRVCHTDGLTTDRTLAYFKWRYIDTPVVGYGLYPQVRDGQLIGLAVLRAYESNGCARGILSELLSVSGEKRSFAEILRGVAAQTSTDYLGAHFKSGSPAHRALRQAGYIRAPSRHVRLATRAVSGDELSHSDIAAWDLSLGDLEIF